MPNPQEAQHWMEGVNYYVPTMQLHSHVGQDGLAKIELGAPVALNAIGVLSAQSIATAGTSTTFAGTYSKDAMSKYGRVVTVVASGAATSLVTVKGRDYLGQPVTEALTLNGTTPVIGKKAFKYVDSVTYAVTAATTINVGWGNIFGLPFKANQLVQEALNDQATANAGVFTAAVTTDPQTGTTGDPRGTYATHASNLPDGVKTFQLVIRCDKTNLHGVKHFGA